MATRKRIPEISFPDSPDETTATILGQNILFIGIHRDETPNNPLEDCDGVGSIDAISNRHHHGISREAARGHLWDDHVCIVPLRYRDYGGECVWEVHSDVDQVFTSIQVARGTCTLLDREFNQCLENFYPDWFENIDGIWTPDQCVRESYMGQDGLTLRQWMIQQAKSACESYTDYCNGNVYGYVVELHTARKDDDDEVITDHDYYDHHTPIEEDSCWGFYGWDYFLDEVKSVVKSQLKSLGYSRRAIAAALKEKEAA